MMGIDGPNGEIWYLCVRDWADGIKKPAPPGAEPEAAQLEMTTKRKKRAG